MSTLTTAELDWLARHWVDVDEFLQEPSDPPIPGELEPKLHLFFTRSDGSKYYELQEDWSTPENHAAIERLYKSL